MTDLDTQTSIVGDYWREQYLLLKAENEQFRAALTEIVQWVVDGSSPEAWCLKCHRSAMASRGLSCSMARGQG